jgi:hypothetical protein
MSLYDMYFSKQNKNYMFNTLSSLILQESGYDIKNDQSYIELYRLYYPGIFDMIDTDEISILNKQLINTIGEIILQRLKEQKPIEKIKEDKNKNKIVDKKKCIKNIYSINREKKSINRFNFKIKLSEYKTFCPKTITLLKEKNILFSNDTIFLRFNDSDNISFIYKDKKKLGNDEYYTYECLSDDIIESKDILSIEILNYLLMTPSTKKDIFKIKKSKNINYEKDKYTCLEIKNNNFIVDQEIGLLNDKQELIKSVFSKHILNDYILIEKTDLKDSKYILKMNQNISIQILI